MHRGPQGVRLIALEGRKTGLVAAVQQVTDEDEELVLISAGGQVIRTDTKSVNRYSSQARGVIVMRLAEGDSVAAICCLPSGAGGPRCHRRQWRPPARRQRTRGRGAGTTARHDRLRRTGDRVYADQYEIYHGNANPELARKIARYLASEPGRAEVFEFANENIFVRILDNVREKDVFLVQPTSRPVNKSIMELLIMIDAFKRASAGRITAVVPYYAYGRSDKKDQPRVPITARLVADMISVAGADRMLTMDLHQGQIQGFFNIPVDELTAVHLLSRYFLDQQLEDVVVVTDLGFAKRARAFAELLDAPLAIVEKRRHGNLDRAEVINVIGDVRGRRAIIVDDEIDTAGTLIEITRALEKEGVHEIYACATHGVLSDPAIERIAASNLREVDHHRHGPAPGRQAHRPDQVLSVAPLIGEAIRRIHRGESVGALFSSEVSFTQEMLLWEDGVDGLQGIDANRPTTAMTHPGATTTYHQPLTRIGGCLTATTRRRMSLQLHRPDGKGGLEVRTGTEESYRATLRSSRWGAALRVAAAGAPQPGDEPHLDGAGGDLLAGPRAGHLRAHRGRVRRRPVGDSSREPRPARRRPGKIMRRILICSGVLGLGTALVFAAAALTANLFPNGTLVSSGWNGPMTRGGWGVAVPRSHVRGRPRPGVPAIARRHRRARLGLRRGHARTLTRVRGQP